MKHAAWILVGPTATGKTAVSSELARVLDADILSADSMLVYRGMDIGTAKPTAAECLGLTMYGLDLATPGEAFSTGAWLDAARAAFEAAEQRGRDLVVAGGTGLYINALLGGLDAPPSDPALRARLEALQEQGGAEALRAYAEAHFPRSVATLADPANPRRLIRLIETRTVATNERRQQQQGRVACSDSIVVGLHVEPTVLARRIVARIAQMFADGLLEEVAALRATYSDFSQTAGKGIGYAEAIAVLDGTLTLEEAQERIAVRTRQLAKRQRTWYRHQLIVKWVAGPVDAADIPRTANDVLKIWKRHGKTPVSV